MVDIEPLQVEGAEGGCERKRKMGVNSTVHYLPMRVYVQVCIYYLLLMLSVASSDLLRAWNLPRCVVGKEAIHILLTHLH